MSSHYDTEITDDAIKNIIEAVNSIPEREVPEGFRNELMRAVRVEASLIADADKDIASLSKARNFVNMINRKKIYICASAVCVLLVFAFLINETGRKSAGSSVTQSADYAPAPAAVPMAEMPEAALADESGLYGGAAEYNYNAAVEEAEIALDDAGFSVASAGGIADTAASIQGDAGVGATEANNKLIKTSYYNMDVVSFDKTVSEIKSVTEMAGGYVESFDSSVYNEYTGSSGRRDLKTGHICLRIPQGEYPFAKTKIEDLGKVTVKSENIDNITSSYVDAKARLEVKKAEEQRLLELFGKAEEIEDLISLEARLTYVRSDIEAMTAQLKSWDAGVAFSTINISITEVIDFSQTQSIDPTLGEKIKEGFNRSIANFTHTIEWLAVKAAENSIAILILIVGAAASVLAVKAARKRRADENK